MGERVLRDGGRPVTVTERNQIIAVDAILAPPAAGDYVIELIVGAGDKTERRFVGIRVRQ